MDGVQKSPVHYNDHRGFIPCWHTMEYKQCPREG